MFGDILDHLAFGEHQKQHHYPNTVSVATLEIKADGAAQFGVELKPAIQSHAKKAAKTARSKQQPKQKPVQMQTDKDEDNNNKDGKNAVAEKPVPADISSADDEYRRRKKRRQQNSKRLGLPSGVLNGQELPTGHTELTSGKRQVQIKPLAEFLIDNPHLVDQHKSTGARCIGVAPEDKQQQQQQQQNAVPMGGTDTKDGSMMDTSDGKHSAEPMLTEDILKEPEDFALLREQMQNIPTIRWLFSDAMVRQNVKQEECMRYLHEKRARMPDSLAEHENLLVAEAGQFVSTAPGAQPGKVYNFPPCMCGQKCVGVTEGTKIAGLPVGALGKVLTKYMDAVEFAEFMRSGSAPVAERMCRDCYATTIALLVYNVRGYAMHDVSSGAVHALAQQSLNGNSDSNGNGNGKSENKASASFGSINSEAHRKCNASLVRMADTLCLNPFTNLCNQPGGYIAECILPTEGRQYEGVIGNVVRFRKSYRNWVFNANEQRWYLSQEAMIWHSPVAAANHEVDLGDPIHHF